MADDFGAFESDPTAGTFTFFIFIIYYLYIVICIL